VTNEGRDQTPTTLEQLTKESIQNNNYNYLPNFVGTENTRNSAVSA